MRCARNSGAWFMGGHSSGWRRDRRGGGGCGNRRHEALGRLTISSAASAATSAMSVGRRAAAAQLASTPAWHSHRRRRPRRWGADLEISVSSSSRPRRPISAQRGVVGAVTDQRPRWRCARHRGSGAPRPGARYRQCEAACRWAMRGGRAPRHRSPAPASGRCQRDLALLVGQRQAREKAHPAGLLLRRTASAAGRSRRRGDPLCLPAPVTEACKKPTSLSRPHDFVGAAVLEHAVPRWMRPIRARRRSRQPRPLLRAMGTIGDLRQWYAVRYKRWVRMRVAAP